MLELHTKPFQERAGKHGSRNHKDNLNSRNGQLFLGDSESHVERYKDQKQDGSLAEGITKHLCFTSGLSFVHWQLRYQNE